jgi:hypothetical protein
MQQNLGAKFSCVNAIFNRPRKILARQMTAIKPMIF